MPNVANIYAQLGDVYGRAAEARKSIWGQAIANISGLPQQVIAARQAEQREQRKAQYDDQHLALERAQLALKQGEVKRADEEYARSQLYNQWEQQITPKALDEQGVWHPDQALAAARDLDPRAVSFAHGLNLKYQPKPIEISAGGTLAVPGDEPGTYKTAFTAPAKVEPGSLAEYVQQQRAELKASGTPETANHLLTWTKDYKNATRPEAQSEWSMFADSYAGSLGKKDWADLTPQQQQGGFAKFAEVKADPAADRQARAIAAQIASQNRQQSFTEKEQGRKVLSSDVEKPYQTAHSSAETLRDTVRAAQAGNKVAGSLQSLETTMTAIRAQGLNRINTAEIGMAGNAGSMMDRIQGWLGKASEGQPVPKDVQEDMLKFADILDKAAYKRYREGHATITQRYGLSDEKPLPDPAPAPTAPPPVMTAAPKLGDVVTVKGQKLRVTKVNKDGSYEGVGVK